MSEELNDNVLADMTKLEKTLTEDLTGDRTRAILAYFDKVAEASAKALQTPANDGERQMASRLSEGFRASQRIVRHVWETLHAASLPA